MKLQRTPLLLLLTALVLGGIVAIREGQKASQPPATETTTQPLFGFKEEAVTALTITRANQTLRFEKVPAAQATKPASAPSPTPPGSRPPAASSPSATVLPSPTPISQALVWQMTQPQKKLAEEAAIAFLLNQMANGKSQQTLSVPAAQKAEFGLDQPLATIQVQLTDQKQHRLVLGKPNFNRSGLYAQIDPPTQPTAEITIHVVSIDLENAVTRPLEEWQAKPEPTPSPAATSPSPSPKPSP